MPPIKCNNQIVTNIQIELSGVTHVKLVILKWTSVSISGLWNGSRSSQKSTKHNAKTCLPPCCWEAANRWEAAYREKLCMARSSVLHTGNSSNCLSSPVLNKPSLVTHAWLSGDPVETGALRSSSSKKDITWIQDLRSGVNSGISTQAIPELQYKCTLISEWTRLFGLLRILDNLFSGTGTREIWKFWEGLGRQLGKFLLPLVVCIDCLDVVTCGVLGGLFVGARLRGWALAAVVSLLVKWRTWTSLSNSICVLDCQPHF